MLPIFLQPGHHGAWQQVLHRLGAILRKARSLARAPWMVQRVKISGEKVVKKVVKLEVNHEIMVVTLKFAIGHG